jgi:hypothetical protein
LKLAVHLANNNGIANWSMPLFNFRVVVVRDGTGGAATVYAV